VSIGNATVTEGNSGTTPATFNVTLSAASGQTVTMNYATADGTALGGSDYQSAAGAISFAPGETLKTVTVNVNGDTTCEANETFTVNLSSLVNASFGTSSGTGTVNNDDTAPSITINDISIIEGDSGSSTGDFTVTLSALSGLDVTVNWATAAGTATAG